MDVTESREDYKSREFNPVHMYTKATKKLSSQAGFVDILPRFWVEC